MTMTAAARDDDLRAEMSVLRRAVEALPTAWTDNQPPDYTPDLVLLNKGLDNVARSLAALEKHPALRLTPEQHQAAIASAGNALMREASRKLDTATMWATRESGQLADMIGVMVDQRQQRIVLMIVLVGVFCITFMMSPFLLSIIPSSFS